MSVSDEASILLVDDEAAVRSLAERILKRAGYSVVTAPDGETALSIVREAGERIGLVMLDLQMPGMGGEDCLVQLRALNRSLPVIVTTGGEPDADTEAVLRASAQATIRKPYDLRQFLALVREFLPDGNGGRAAETSR